MEADQTACPGHGEILAAREDCGARAVPARSGFALAKA